MGTYRKLSVNLKRGEVASLRKFFQGTHPVRLVQRARTLLFLDEGLTAPTVAMRVGLSGQGVRDIGWRYCEGGLDQALYDRARPGAVPALDDAQRQRIIAMVCSEPPQGHARWSVRLITAEAVKRKLVPRIGRETIRILLEHHDLKPWREKNVVCGPDR